MKTYTFVLEVPDEIYQRLVEIAQREEKTPEKLRLKFWKCITASEKL